MPSKIQSLRQKAFQLQCGRCWYCGVQMWRESPSELPNVNERSASRLRCTAEHLVAQRDGGKHEPSNVVAACAHCNQTRHKRKNPPEPLTYLSNVRKRVSLGRWHHSWVREYGLLPATCMSHRV